jgi:hypothetical protein
MLLTRYIHGRFGLPGAQARAAKVSEGDCTHCQCAGGSLSRSVRFGRLVSMISLLPLAVAVCISCSRVVDNRHFPADIVGGALLGGSIALFVHGLWL